MNGRVNEHDATPEERIAAVARSLVVQMEKNLKRQPDYADYRDAIRPFLQVELIRARIDEARLISGIALTARMRELSTELEQALRALPDEHNVKAKNAEL
jgi:hypothetical protein